MDPREEPLPGRPPGLPFGAADPPPLDAVLAGHTYIATGTGLEDLVLGVVEGQIFIPPKGSKIALFGVGPQETDRQVTVREVVFDFNEEFHRLYTVVVVELPT